MSADLLALVERTTAAHALLAEGRDLLVRGTNELLAVHQELGPLLRDLAPRCPTCAKPMGLKYGPGATLRPFWSCPSWEKHKKKGERCSMDYETWLRTFAPPAKSAG